MLKDSSQFFHPSTGLIQEIKIEDDSKSLTFEEDNFPKNIRCDYGYISRSTVTDKYDSLILKVICYDKNRSLVIEDLSAFLKSLVIKGIKTNLFSIIKALNSTQFLDIKYNTKSYEKLNSSFNIKSLSIEAFLNYIKNNFLNKKSVADKSKYLDLNKIYNISVNDNKILLEVSLKTPTTLSFSTYSYIDNLFSRESLIQAVELDLSKTNIGKLISFLNSLKEGVFLRSNIQDISVNINEELQEVISSYPTNNKAVLASLPGVVSKVLVREGDYVDSENSYYSDRIDENGERC